jgi:hypothetical protein
MREYIRLLEELGLEVTEASVSRLSGYWFIRARSEEEGLEYTWAVDPARGPIVDDLDEEVVPFQALTAWEIL